VRRFSACATAMLVGALVFTRSAAAQTISLVPADTPRWDVGGTVGWLGRTERSAVGTFRDGTWLNAGSFGASLAYHWNPHLIVEGEVATSSSASFYSLESVAVSGRSTPTFLSREHHVKTTGGSASIVYQFFENRWVHPFLTAGVESVRNRDRIETFAPLPTPAAPFSVPTIASETKTADAVRPLFGGGFKFYVTERAFIRTDVRFAFDGPGLASTTWRSGIGVDF